MTKRGRPWRRRAYAVPAVLMAVLGLMGAALAGCGGAADIADHTGGGLTTTSTTSNEPPATAPTPPSFANLPDGFGDGPPGSGMSRFTQQKLDWQPCEGGECADIWVPLDYDDPDGPAITVKAEKQVATDPAKRVGSLFINPGGPGVPGIDYLGYVGLPANVRALYDVVGFDPRGVGRSTPVDCLSDTELDAYIASDPTPDDAAEIQQLEDDFATYAQGCLDRSGPLVEHVSTVEVARDLDLMRQLVGDEKLNWFGSSYGTYIGATYAGLFPKNVGRMVLDGAVDPLADPHQVAVNQTKGFEEALDAFLQHCVDQGGCPLGDSVAAGKDRLIQLFHDADRRPLSSATGREVTEAHVFLGVLQALYSEQLWPILTQALQQAVNGQGDTLLGLSDFYNHRMADGTYAANTAEVGAAVNCLDHPEDLTLQQILANKQEFLAAAPVFGKVGMWFDYGCSNWPVNATVKQPDFTAKGAAPIVVVGTTHDPATPYQQAVRLADELESGVLLSRDGEGHTGYNSGNSCIDDAINGYLITGNPPADGTMC